MLISYIQPLGLNDECVECVCVCGGEVLVVPESRKGTNIK